MGLNMTQVLQAIKEAKHKIIGLKQTLRAIQQDKIDSVYIANDIEDHILRQITEMCRQNSIPLVPVNINRKELGKLCRIEVGATVVSLMR